MVQRQMTNNSSTRPSVDRSALLRQWLIVKAIAAAGGAATIKTLVERAGKSEKTIRRDLALLRKVGFPIVETSGDFGRKTFALENGELPRLDLCYDEALALFFCRRAVLPLAGTMFWQSADNAFTKIKASLGRRAADYLDRMFSRVYHTQIGGDYAGKSELIDRLLVAVEECRVAFITYHSSRSSEPLTYPIEPYGLIAHRGSLYVVGHSQQHNEVRHWKVDRLESVTVERFPFERPADFDLERHLAGSLGIYHGRQSVRVRVRFTPAAARYLREKRMHASQRITRQRDGGAIVEWTLTSTVEARSFILSFGSSAEVLEPAALRAEIAAEVAALAEKYGMATTRQHSKRLRASAGKAVNNEK
ncbi:MAG TPA: WYL domain-containing transcriptional regulator [Pirellulales bacterium]|nr:WYL domain-containing transcriptional regulator [Pirellulales bacterium]